jgi:hypothetical protein
MKAGQLVIFDYGGKFYLYAKVLSVSNREMKLEVLSGGYDMRVVAVDVPEDKRQDYNAAIQWYLEQERERGKK